MYPDPNAKVPFVELKKPEDVFSGADLNNNNNNGLICLVNNYEVMKRRGPILGKQRQVHTGVPLDLAFAIQVRRRAGWQWAGIPPGDGSHLCLKKYNCRSSVIYSLSFTVPAGAFTGRF